MLMFLKETKPENIFKGFKESTFSLDSRLALSQILALSVTTRNIHANYLDLQTSISSSVKWIL